MAKGSVGAPNGTFTRGALGLFKAGSGGTMPEGGH